MNTTDFKAALREKAIEKLDDKSIDIRSLDRQAVIRLVEELQIHQVELEIQNEELKSAQLISEATKSRYVSLFDNAPSGYVVLDNAGIIKEFNSTFKSMVDNRLLSGANIAFAGLLEEGDDSAFRARFRALFKHPDGKQAEYKIAGKKGGSRHIQIQARHHTKSFYGSGSDMDELLLMVTDITELKATKQDLKASLVRSQSREKEVQALLKGARAILEQADFQTTARKIFDICSGIIGSTSGYVALLSENGDENEVLFLEAGGLPCTVNPELPMPIRGLREVAYQTNQTVYDNHFRDSQWMKFMPKGHVVLKNVMFAPLVIENKTVGIIGLANKEGGFTDENAKTAGGFGKMCAIALQNSRNLDMRDAAEDRNRKLISELKEALANIKQLSGLLPICTHCKKVRSDEGYWERIELYVQDHSEAEFSHSICRDCAKTYYPDYDIYDD